MRVLRIGLLTLGIALLAMGAAAQDVPLTWTEPTLGQRVNAFGVAEWFAEGRVTNEGTAAYLNVMLEGDVTDADGEVIGVAYGVLVDACGLSVRPERTIEPGESAPYLLTVELDADDLEPAALDLSASATETDATRANPFLTYPDVTTVYSGDVARVEWTRQGALRFADGCADDVYVNWGWYEADAETGDYAAIDLPYPDSTDAAILTRLDLDNEAELRHARIAYHPLSRRFIFQSPINVVMTAEPDGTFQRLLWDGLWSYSLQGYVWLPDERLLAYYFGAYGEPVRYFTGSAAGQRISTELTQVTPSLIVPGPTPDGARVVIAQTVDGVTGYYLASTTNPSNQTKLFDGDAPGNNYPAPVFSANASSTYIYVIRNVGGQARLQCFDMATQTLNNLTVLPLNLADDESGWMSVSPSGQVLALGAEGRHGGVWLVDLTQYSTCQR